MQTFLTGVFINKLVSAFSMMLLHSLWQGLILAVAVYMISAITKKQKAAVRYNLVLIMFAAFVIAVVFTFTWQWNNVYTENSHEIFANGFSEKVSQLFAGNLQPVKQVLTVCIDYFTTHQRFIVAAWLIIFSFKVIKISGALFYNHAVKRKQVFAAGEYWDDTLTRLRSSLGMDKMVVLLESGCMKMPVVIGHLKPVILMPVGLLLSLPAEQAEAILLHELAHIRRNDYLVNLLQHIAETVFFFNLGVLWVSSWIREERENCCDDVALAQTEDKTELAAALISFKQHELYGNVYAPAFPGKKNQLLRRVSRILGGVDKSTSISEKMFFLFVFLLLLTGAGAMMLVHKKEMSTAKFSETKKADLPTQQNVVAVEKASAQKKLPQKVAGNIKKINAFEKTIVFKNIIVAEVPAISEETEPLTAKQISMMDEERAKKDQVRAMKDQEKAKMDQQQAAIDQKKAMIDQEIARKDQQRASLNQEQAMKDQVNAKLDQEQAGIQYQKALKDKKAAERAALFNKTSNIF